MSKGIAKSHVTLETYQRPFRFQRRFRESPSRPNLDGGWGVPSPAWCKEQESQSHGRCELNGSPENLKINGIFRDPQWWDPLMVSFPYYSHTIPISLGILMGVVWEAYHKGFPLLGVPGITLDKDIQYQYLWTYCWWYFNPIQKLGSMTWDKLPVSTTVCRCFFPPPTTVLAMIRFVCQLENPVQNQIEASPPKKRANPFADILPPATWLALKGFHDHFPKNLKPWYHTPQKKLK